MIPADGNIFFDMEFVGNDGYSLGNDWTIQTMPNGGDISGHGTAPRGVDYPLRIQAGDYTLAIRNGYSALLTG